MNVFTALFRSVYVLLYHDLLVSVPNYVRFILHNSVFVSISVRAKTMVLNDLFRSGSVRFAVPAQMFDVLRHPSTTPQQSLATATVQVALSS